MYDNFGGSSRYHQYRAMIKQIWNDELLMDADELSEKVYKSYCDGKLSAQQYDSLCDLICDV